MENVVGCLKLECDRVQLGVRVGGADGCERIQERVIRRPKLFIPAPGTVRPLNTWEGHRGTDHYERTYELEQSTYALVAGSRLLVHLMRTSQSSKEGGGIGVPKAMAKMARRLVCATYLST